MTSEAKRRRRQLREQIRALTFVPLMRGSIVERRRQCGRPNCACAKDSKARHPGKFLAVTLQGRTQVMHLRRQDEEPVRQAILAYGKMWEAIEGLTVCELAQLRHAARERRIERRRGGAKAARPGKEVGS